MMTLLLCMAWLLGIACSAWVHFTRPWLPALAAALLALLVERRPLGRSLPIAAICAGTALLAVARWQMASGPQPPTSVAHLIDGGRVRLLGVLRDDAEQRERSQRLRVRIREADPGDGWRPATGGVLVRTALGRTFRAGDTLLLEGNLREPPDLPHFEYRAYLARQGIVAQMDYPRLRVTGHQRPGSPFRPAWLRDARRAASGALERALPQPAAALAQGIVTGERAAIPRAVIDDFNRSGTSHLIAISGFNITLVSGVTVTSLAWLVGRRRAALLTLLAITLYALFVGLTPSVARALVMGILVILAAVLGRPGAPAVSLALAAAVMTAQDPRVLNDLAFQLSFTATAGILFLAPTLQAVGRSRAATLSLPDWCAAPLLGAWDTLAVTLAATAATLPLMLHAFGRLSLVAPLANLVLAPVFPLAMVSAALCAALVSVAPMTAPVAGALAWPPLAFTLQTAHIAAALPGASMTTGHPSGVMVMLMYAGGAGLLVVRAGRRHDRGTGLGPPVTTLPAAAPIALAVASTVVLGGLVLATLVAHRTTDGQLTVIFTEAGGVPVALISGPSGERVLVDSGPTSSALARAIDPLLPARDRRVDLILATRQTLAATGGLAAAVKRYRVDTVLGPVTAEEEISRLAGSAAFSPIEPGTTVHLSRGARLEVMQLPNERDRLAVVAVLGSRRIAVTSGPSGDIGPRRGPSGRPGDVRITLAALPSSGFDLRSAGPVRVSTDGVALRIRPARGPLLPALIGMREAGEREGHQYAILGRAVPQEAAADPRRRTPARPTSSLSHHAERARLRRGLGTR